jgi:multiple sugar transport system ATP-binding protein
MASVVFDHVVKQYGELPPVVKDLSLRIDDREFLVIVGPSGCGKSTALRMIAGLEDVSGGTLRIDGQVVNDVEPKNRDIAMVFQNYALYPHMTCYENMAFALEMRKLPKNEIQRRVMAAARALEIEHLFDRKPKALSGGQRQRVAIGRAIVREPKVFLMDEPLSNLDAQLRVAMRAEIKKLHRRLKTTIVYVTHDQSEAMTLGDRIAILRAGDLMQCDAPHEVYANPANVFVATFIGSPQMNMLRGEMEIDGNTTTVRGKNFSFIVPKRPSHRPGKVLVGIRPEHLAIAGEDERNKLTSTVEVTEPMGFETYVYLAGEDGSVVVRLPEASAPGVSATVSVTTEPSKIYWFDPESEKRLA